MLDRSTQARGTGDLTETGWLEGYTIVGLGLGLGFGLGLGLGLGLG